MLVCQIHYGFYAKYVLVVALYLFHFKVALRQERHQRSRENTTETHAYADRLKSLHIPTLEDRRFCADMLYIFEVLHHKIDCSLANLGLTLLQSKTRGNNLNFVQRRAISKLCASLFPHRAASS